MPGAITTHPQTVTAMTEFKHEAAHWFQSLQDRICNALETTDGGTRFKEDKWERPGGGGGRSRVISRGAVLEKGGVNFSAVHGRLPERIASALHVEADEFFATGVSIVLHPNSPMVPIIHANVRYFELSNGIWWFGGGIDLTPIYVVDEDAAWFHRQLKGVCDQHNAAYYDRFKTWADDYFYIKHRGETRGVGGIFFDHLTGDGQRGQIFNFVQGVGDVFAPTYTQLMDKYRNTPYNEEQKQWQLLRRGRYVEFNLVYDKGTKFGLDTDGRTESILMSLPLHASWEYNHHPLEGTPEAITLTKLQKGINWAEMAVPATH